jgi:signal transduction histidine kinase
MTKILCVDDEPVNLELLEALLVPAGYEVLRAESGEKALALIRTEDPGLVLLDVMMPGLSGYDVLKKIRGDEKIRDVPVVMVTALKDVEDRVRALEAGCDDFLSKPFEKNELLARVKSLVRMRYISRQLNEKEKFESVLNQMDEGLIVLDDKFGVIAHNPPSLELLEIEPAKIPDNLVAHLTGRFKVHYQGDLSAALRTTNLSFDIERPATEKFRELILDVKSSVIRPPEGETSTIVLTLRDVTAHRLQDRLEWTFMDTISHKLHSPLAGIIGQEAVLKQGFIGQLTAEQQKSVDIIYDQSLKLSGLLDKILKFIELTSVSIELPNEDMELAKALREIGEAAGRELKGKKIELKIESEDISWRANRKHLELILNNLIENAVKFSDRDPVKINISAKKTAGGIIISIVDNGRGIPPEDQGNIFERFYQVEKYETGNVEGIGLGLALVKRIVSDHGGKISVRSTIGQGTEFIIELPA